MKISLKNLILFALTLMTLASNNLFGLGDQGKTKRVKKPRTSRSRFKDSRTKEIQEIARYAYGIKSSQTAFIWVHLTEENIFLPIPLDETQTYLPPRPPNLMDDSKNDFGIFADKLTTKQDPTIAIPVK